MDRCLLNRQDIGAVTENDHKVRQCLCHLCTCGKHRCPSEPRKQRGSYSTHYQETYRPKTPVSVSAHPALPYRPNTAKIDFETSHMRDYKSYCVQPSLTPPVRGSTPSLPFTGNSSYVADFPNWGEVDTCIERRPKLPSYRLRFSGKSQYQSAYRDTKTASPSKSTPRKESSILMGTWESPVVPTSKSAYCAYAASHYSPIRPPRKSERYSTLSSSPVHYRSSSQADYQPKQPTFKDPHMIARGARH